MTRRSSGGSDRTTRPSSRQAITPEPSPLRWLQGTFQLVTGVGAVATANHCGAGSLALPDRQDIVRFISVRALSRVPLNEYLQRSAVFKKQSAGHRQGQGRRLAPVGKDPRGSKA